MKVLISAEAARDIEQIGDYIARDNPSRAVSFLRELRGKCVDLGDMPEAFPVMQRYKRFGVRRRVYGNYLIFYRVGVDQVVVLHVLHGAMDYVPLIFPDGEAG